MFAVDHVIHISVDGLNSNLLKSQIDAFPLLYSNFVRFVDEGATTFNARTDFTHTNTIPNHTSMQTGRPVSQPSGAPNTTYHGYTNNGHPGLTATLHNDGNPNLSYVSSVFDVAHDNGLSTALYASKEKFVIYDQSYNASTGALDATGPDNGRDKIDAYVQNSIGSTLNTNYLSDMAASEYNYTFLHYRDPDTTGHTRRWGSTAWYMSVQDVDSYLGDILNLVESDAGLIDETIIIVTTDHGGSEYGHSAPSLEAHYTIPLFVWGPGIAAGADLYELNSTSRLDPGSGRPDYNAVVQPIRSGDTGNLALNLLGLEAVPGSLINSSQDLLVSFLSDFDGDGDVDEFDFSVWQLHNGVDDGADADNDGDTDGADFLIWQQQFTGSLSPPLLSDFDGDGDVDGFDFSVWQLHNGVDGGADADSDGDTDGADFLIWQRQFTGSLSPPLSASTAVPEPSSLVLLIGPVIVCILARNWS
ncbi:MAG: alkaline phosphatase [Pirellulales bacterium]|nr:alkaline phosphatase [Pirellulales bacterium]